MGNRSGSPGRAGMGTSFSKPIPVVGPTPRGMGRGARMSSNGVENNKTGSQSSISFSYTHVDAPSPSSSYGRSATVGKGPTGPGTGWTMVTSPLSSSSHPQASSKRQSQDGDVENEVEVDENGSVTELGGAGVGHSRNRRIKEGKEAIKYDVEDIVNGAFSPHFCCVNFSCAYSAGV